MRREQEPGVAQRPQFRPSLKGSHLVSRTWRVKILTARHRTEQCIRRIIQHMYRPAAYIDRYIDAQARKRMNHALIS
jgi:hypothetical protein